MTVLSVNINKIALLRNSRGRDYPSVIGFAERCLDLDVKGITVHPRPDERHIRRSDVYELSKFLGRHRDVEFNIEGYPTSAFLDLVLAIKPAQCTLVPDAPGQLTSDHGWDVGSNRELLQTVIGQLKKAGIRSSLFVDPVNSEIELIADIGVERIELYTEEYASAYSGSSEDAVFEKYRSAASCASALGIGLNAGHDLNLQNLARFLQIPRILEVSIGHALVMECLEIGIEAVIRRYLTICSKAED
jgi:pyridoxine 5-phosphate synthase